MKHLPKYYGIQTFNRVEKGLKASPPLHCYLDFETAEHSSAVPSGILVDIILDKTNFSWGFLHSGERGRSIEYKSEKY